MLAVGQDDAADGHLVDLKGTRAGGCVKVGLVFLSATDSYCDLLQKIWIVQRGAASDT